MHLVKNKSKTEIVVRPSRLLAATTSPKPLVYAGGMPAPQWRSACRTLRFASHAVGLLLIVLLTIFAAINANACMVCFVPYKSLLDKVESDENVVLAKAVDQAERRWNVVRVIKGAKAQVNQPITLDLSKSENFQPGDIQLLRYSELDATWLIENPVDRDLQGFLINSLALASRLSEKSSLREQAAYFEYFVPFLEHSNPAVADSAYNKLARAPYAVLQIVGRDVDPQQLNKWIVTPAIVKNRGSLYITLLGICGGERERELLKRWIKKQSASGSSSRLAPMLVAFAELNDEESLQFIEQEYLLNRERTLGEIVAAVEALRLHGGADTELSRKRILASYHLLLRERPQLAELIIADCAAWKDWSIAHRLLDIHLSGKQPWNNNLILEYMQKCPLPIAKRFLDRISTAVANSDRDK